MLPQIFAIAAALISACLQAQPEIAPVPPAKVNGVTIIEPPLNYRVELEVTLPDRPPIPLAFEQPNHAQDRLKLSTPSAQHGTKGERWSMYYDLLDPVDAHYREFGFQPVLEPVFIQPQNTEKSALLSPNDPTTRQICGGFAMAALWGGEFRLATDSVWSVVQHFERILHEADTRGGDVVVWYHKGRHPDGTPKAEGIAHYALLEIRDGTRFIYTKNGNERAYYGRLAHYNQPARPGKLSLISRLTGDPETMEYTFYRVPWDEARVKRSGRPHADEMPPDGSVPLRFQVVDAATYELLPGARVWMTFAGRSNILIDQFVDGNGAATANQIPGSSGNYDVRASADGYELGICHAAISAGEKVNIIIPLKKKAGGDDAVKTRFTALQSELEEVTVAWSLALRRGDSERAQALAARMDQINAELAQLWEANPHLEKFFFETQAQSTDRITRRLEKE
jgi:hypothetical protein